MKESKSKPFTVSCGPAFRLLASVTDKRGLEKLKPLTERGAEVISTGGTASTLRGIGIECIDVSEITGFPEMLDGRIKILHPNIFGGLLAAQGNVAHMNAISEHLIAPIHAVFVNLYDFEEKQATSRIDVGGPSAIRAAAKNGLIVVVDPDDYDEVIEAMLASEDGSVPLELRLKLAAKVFDLTSRYDGLISQWLEECAIAGIDPFALEEGHH